jgi:hypothetical protein
MTDHDFNKQFDPREYYRCLRTMGFTRDDAKKMTHHYHKSIYDVVNIMYELRYHMEKPEDKV